jgi:hypothetical protein
LKVQYRAANTSPGDNQVAPHFRIVNTGSTSVPLTELKIRYWYTVDGDKPQAFWVDWASSGVTASGSFVKLATARSGADYNLEVSFSAGSVAANSSVDVQDRFNKTDWTNYNETGDYSFDPTKSAFADWTKVTLYRNGTRVWGAGP